MAESPTCSPRAKWKRPSDVMKMRRRKKVQGGQNTTLNSPQTLIGSSQNAEKERTRVEKRRNPFGCRKSPRKRVYLSTSDSDVSEETAKITESQRDFFKSLDHPLVKEMKPEVLNKQVFRSSQESQVTKSAPCQPEVEVQKKVESQPECPVDWSIKTRIRFLSPETFNWCMNLKSTEESAGINAFVRCQPYEKIESVQDLQKNAKARSQFQQCLHTWIHPNIPWIKLFPRLSTDIKQTSKTSFAVNQEIQDSLISDWSGSFHSVFHMLRSKQCPYFYLCAHQFTVLFRAAGIGGVSKPSALITPTTRGLREALKNQGIDFSMPLASSGAISDAEKSQVDDDKMAKEKSTTGNDTSDLSGKGEISSEDENDEDIAENDLDILESDAGASSWLQSMGLDKKSFPSLDPHKVKLQQDKTVKVDHRIESLVQIVDIHTQALFNFLLNSKSTVAISGPQAGIPPTIMAPVAFQGATLRTHKVKLGTVQQYRGGRQTSFGNLEITGPILPHSVFHLCRLFQQTQTGEFAMSSHTHDATVPFNAALGGEESQDNQTALTSLEQCGLQRESLERFVWPTDLGTLIIRELKCEDGTYTWELS